MHLTERCWSVCRAGAWGRWMSMFTPDGVGVRVIVCLRYPTGRTNALCLSTVRVCVVSTALTKNLWVQECTYACAQHSEAMS